MNIYNEKLGLDILEHVGIMLDGNRRWAKKKHMPRNFGHLQGSRVLEQICDDADEIGIKYLTVYVFSTENWKRSAKEVDGLMKILRNYLKDCIKRANKNNMKVRILGKRERLDEDIIKSIDELEKASAGNTGLVFQVALNYGGRDEIVRAVRKLAKDVRDNGLDPDSVDEELFEGYLDTAGVPDPDLIIRTSGEKRISNFLMWQSAYSEFDFPEILWPDFNKNRLIEAVERYNKRDRRFGGAKEE
ncbi:MAG: isoprenyl transferase [Butyrivibrio sp.]|nr:isoprenyl transferase [Butyrivibrio sp.]